MTATLTSPPNVKYFVSSYDKYYENLTKISFWIRCSWEQIFKSVANRDFSYLDSESRIGGGGCLGLYYMVHYLCITCDVFQLPSTKVRVTRSSFVGNVFILDVDHTIMIQYISNIIPKNVFCE